MLAVQTSLLDQGVTPAARTLGPTLERRPLGQGAWLDVQRAWIDGAGALMDRLVGVVPWQAERRRMYDRVVDVPRLVRFYGDGDALPDPLLDEARAALGEHYRAELGEPFTSAGMCLYRDGRDSVAWHGDTTGRGSSQDTMVAIVSLGAARVLALRPLTGGQTVRITLGTGDLVVMGGSCQRTWQHAVPKTTRAVGARISVQFRPRGVR
jgi:alkylated DNA repair dioxygenase AlkB